MLTLINIQLAGRLKNLNSFLYEECERRVLSRLKGDGGSVNKGIFIDRLF